MRFLRWCVQVRHPILETSRCSVDGLMVESLKIFIIDHYCWLLNTNFNSILDVYYCISFSFILIGKNTTTWADPKKNLPCLQAVRLGAPSRRRLRPCARRLQRAAEFALRWQPLLLGPLGGLPGNSAETLSSYIPQLSTVNIPKLRVL